MMIFSMKIKSKEKLYIIISLIFLIFTWHTASVIVAKEILIPSPIKTFQEVIILITSEKFFISILSTIKRCIGGFIISLFFAMILGLLSGFSDIVYYLLKPIMLLCRSIPTMAFILLALIWLDSNNATIFVGFLVIFPILYENVVQGIRNVDKQLINVMDIYNISKIDRLRNLYIPSIRSYLNSAIISSIGLNLKIVISAEVLSQSKYAIGTSLQLEKMYFNTAGVFAWTIIAVFLAGLIEFATKFIIKKLNY